MFVANLKEGQLEELLHIPEPWYIETDDPICDDSIAGNDLFGLFQQLAG
ncbi:hypothetical protein [Paenibacillus barengoltzii]